MNRFISILLCFFFVASSLWAQKNLTTLLEENIFSAPDGQEKSLAEIIKAHEGKVIYIDFWASWCGPCKKEMPHSIQLQESLKGQDIVFIFLSIDEKEIAWQTATKNLNIVEKGEHWRKGQKEAAELLKTLYIYSIPHYIIVGKNGQLSNLDALPPSDPRVARQLKKMLK